MKIVVSALKSLIREAINSTRIVKERPWALEYEFTLKSGTASDSEGPGPDGFAVILKGESGKTMRVIVDSYWNPQAGDKSGNSLKIEIDGQTPPTETYVPTRFDTGTAQRLIISNSPVAGLLTVAHAAEEDAVPIVMLAVPNPFETDEDVEFDSKKLGNGDAQIKLLNHNSL